MQAQIEPAGLRAEHGRGRPRLRLPRQRDVLGQPQARQIGNDGLAGGVVHVVVGRVVDVDRVQRVEVLRGMRQLRIK